MELISVRFVRFCGLCPVWEKCAKKVCSSVRCGYCQHCTTRDKDNGCSFMSTPICQATRLKVKKVKE